MVLPIHILVDMANCSAFVLSNTVGAWTASIIKENWIKIPDVEILASKLRYPTHPNALSKLQTWFKNELRQYCRSSATIDFDAIFQCELIEQGFSGFNCTCVLHYFLDSKTEFGEIR